MTDKQRETNIQTKMQTAKTSDGETYIQKKKYA